MPWLSLYRDGATAGTCHDDSLDVCPTALQALRRLLAVKENSRLPRSDTVVKDNRNPPFYSSLYSYRLSIIRYGLIIY